MISAAEPSSQKRRKQHEDGVRPVLEKLISIERDAGLLELELGGYKIYQHLRLAVYYRLVGEMGIFAPRRRLGVLERVRNFGRYVGRGARYNELLGIGQSDLLLIGSGRVSYSDGRPMDMFLDYIVPELRSNYVTAFSQGDDLSAVGEPNKEKKRVGFEYFMLQEKLAERWLRLRHGNIAPSPLTNDAHRIAQTISYALGDLIDADVNLPFLFRHVLISHLKIKSAERFLDLVRPRLVVAVVGYEHSNFIAVAKRRGVKTAELQHSVIYPYHPGYHFPHVEQGQLESFPDYFLSYGKYWSGVADFPIKADCVIPVGFAHFEKLRRRYAGERVSREREILFVSQSVVGRGLFSLAVEAARKLPDYRIIFKLHPKQYRDGVASVASDEDRLPENLVVYGRDGPDLYELLGRAEWQVGVFSTVMYEGLGMGTRTIIHDLPGWEHVAGLLDRNHAVLARNCDEVVALVRAGNDMTTPVSPEAFFGSDCVSRTVSVIEGLLAAAG